MKIENFKLKILLKPISLVILLTIFGAFLRFYNLNWGAPYYFHPDERNVASSVSQLAFPNQMNPHFFAYGSLPIYTIYFTGLISNYLSTFNFQLSANVTFDQAIIISRVYSAIFSILLIPLLFVLASKLTSKPQASTAGLFAAFLAATSVGFIQFAHFGTFEMWLTFFGTVLFWLCLKKMTQNIIFLMGLVFGALVATKVSSLALLPLPLLVIFFSGKMTNAKYQISNVKKIIGYWILDIRHWILFSKNFLLFLIISASIYVISNPYVFWDPNSFESSMKYESSVALGTLPVFYTGEFYNAIPGLFHFLFVYPFLLNPLITFLFIPSCIYIVYKGFKTKNIPYLLLVAFYLFLFVSQIFIFVKWTRYMMPTLPFIYLLVTIALADFLLSFRATERSRGIFSHQAPLLKRSLHFAIAAVGMTCLIFSFSYFITAFVQPDTRITAKQFAQRAISPNIHLLSEVYDLGITPFNNAFQDIKLFNFYDLDPGNPILNAELQTELKQSDYIVLPSQRVLKIRLNNQEKFPNGYSFYNDLITGKLGYEKIYESPCDLFCKITYLGDPIFRYEETANVFDRPTVFIYRKK